MLPHPRADVCGDQGPLLDYRAIVDTEKCREFISEKAPGRMVKVLDSLRQRQNTDSEQQIKLDESFMNRINNAGRVQERNESSGRTSEPRFFMRKVCKGKPG